MPALKFKQLLNQLEQVGQAELTEQKKTSLDAAGMSNAVKFWQTDQLGGATKLAVSNPKENKGENVTGQVQKILMDEGVDTRFLLNFLTYEKNDRKVSLQASEEALVDYIPAHKGQFTRKQIVDIFAQILLGIKALHEKGLTHGDVASRNTLVSLNKQNQFVIVVCDLDSVTRRTKEQELEFEKSRDYYMAFSILADLINAAKPGEITLIDPAVNNLRSLLFAKGKPNKIEDALNMDFFGPTPEAREEFFQELRDRENPYEFLGEYQYRARAFEEGNFFLLIRDDLKPIYHLAQQLDSQFDFFDNIDDKPEIFAEKNLDLAALSLESLTEFFKKFNTQITQDINQASSPAIKEVLENLKTEAADRMLELQKQKLYIRLGAAQLHYSETINTPILQGIVTSSIEEHTNKNKNISTSNKLFSTQSASDQVGIARLKTDIEQAIKDNKSNNDVLKIICDFLEEPKGNGKDLFKKVLAHNISQIAHCAPNKLYERVKNAEKSGAMRPESK